MSARMALIFVFGTLKRGFPLHEAGLAHARFLGQARTAQRCPMLVAGRWLAPMMIDLPGLGWQVRGVLFEVDERDLARLDDLESVGQPGNFRRSIVVEVLDGGRRCEAFAFVKAPELAQPRHTHYLEDYQDQRFIPPERR